MTYVSEFAPPEIAVQSASDDEEEPTTSLNNTTMKEADTLSLVSASSFASLSPDQVKLLLQQTLDQLDTIHAKKAYTPSQHYQAYKKLKESVKQTLEPILEDIKHHEENSKEFVDESMESRSRNNSELVGSYQPLAQQYSQIQVALNSWKTEMENTTPDRVQKIINFIREFDQNGEKSEQQIETIIKDFKNMKKTAKFNGIELPGEMWQDIESDISRLEKHLPTVKLRQKKEDCQMKLRAQIETIDDHLKYWSTPYKEFEQAEEIYNHYVKNSMRLISDLKNTENELNEILDQVGDGGKSDCTSGVKLEITSMGPLLDEVVRNWTLFNRHCDKLAGFLSDPEVNTPSKQQYKQIYS